jgi:hypothetical protein
MKEIGRGRSGESEGERKGKWEKKSERGTAKEIIMEQNKLQSAVAG